MIGGNIFGSSAFLIFGPSSQFGEVVGQILLSLAIVLGLLVITSFVITRAIKLLLK